MCTFAVAEPVSKIDSTIYAQALLMIMLCFGLAHTIVLDKDSKFYATFAPSCQLMNLNFHTISSKTHEPMIVERINRYLNKGIKTFSEESGTTAVSREAILILIYRCNSCPFPMNGITRSMIVCGRQFSFPIDFGHETAVCITGNKKWTETYATNQARLQLHSREIEHLLIDQNRSYHRERMNELRPDPLQYEVGDLVLAKRDVKSDKAKNKVDKAQYAYTGPWEITKKLRGGSYDIKHSLVGNWTRNMICTCSLFPRNS